MHSLDSNQPELYNRQALGKRGEQKVVQHLQQNGYAIIEQNYRSRMGEIDIIARKDEVIAFVEVKLRMTEYFPMSEIITPSKQMKIIKTARWYTMQHEIHNAALRFDVALVKPDNGSYAIDYIENAFTSYDYGYTRR